ncbi:hypothetical protein KJ925_01505 [Patescibacteria group bacterium]|nr:hypothetical protein [Patescibacteria group bacterium]
MKRRQVFILLLDSYLAAIRGSVGSKMFRHLFASVGGKKQDIAKDGALSCGIFVSRVLVMFGLVKETHATVEGTLKDMEASGWKTIRTPRVGAVVVWEPVGAHRHIGFVVGKGRAISNSTVKHVPVEHSLWKPAHAHGTTRRIESIWWYRKLSPLRPGGHSG